jgi:subtilisin family serine protease
MKRPAIYPWWAASALVALVCLTLEVPARAQSPASTHKFDEVVRGAVAEGRSVSAIVRFRSEAARARGAAIVATRGGSIRAAHNDVTALTVDVDASTASVLATDLGILTISVDAPVRSAGVAMPVISARASGASRARAQFERTGHGLTVAVIDSGVHPHDDLPAHRIRKFVDFVNGRETPYDDFGHGTHVAGILAGNGARSSSLDDPYIGIAPGADVVALKVLDAEGVGKTSDVIAALEWVAQHHLEYNIRVVNLSLGHPVYRQLKPWSPAALLSSPLPAISGSTQPTTCLVMAVLRRPPMGHASLPLARLTTRERTPAVTMSLRITAPAVRRAST